MTVTVRSACRAFVSVRTSPTFARKVGVGPKSTGWALRSTTARLGSLRSAAQTSSAEA